MSETRRKEYSVILIGEEDVGQWENEESHEDTLEVDGGVGQR